MAIGGNGGGKANNPGNGGAATASSTDPAGGDSYGAGGGGGNGQDSGGDGGHASGATGCPNATGFGQGGDGGDPIDDGKIGGKGGNGTRRRSSRRVMLHRRRSWFRFGLPLGIVVAAVWGLVFVIPGPGLTQPRPRAVLQNARHAAVAHQHLDDSETRMDGARRTAIATEDARRPTRPTGELREASDQVWAEAVAGFTDLGMDLPEGHWPGMVPDITAEAAAAVVSAHGAFRARLLEVHRPFAELAREKVRILLDYGAAGSGDDASLEQARSDPETIWIASSSDGSKSVVLKRGAYPELDAAYDAFATVWNSRKAHYRSMLRAFETAPFENAR